LAEAFAARRSGLEIEIEIEIALMMASMLEVEGEEGRHCTGGGRHCTEGWGEMCM
jgi:hypothetical protein